MDGRLLESSLSNWESDVEGSRKQVTPASPFRYTDIFYKHFPFYLAIGMTDEQFWDGDCLLVKYYREAENLRNEKLNQQAWLQGMYFYDALARISPILHPFAKKGTKAKPYVEEPYPICKESIEDSKEREEKAKSQKGMMYMQAFAIKNNKRFKEGE